ncbi:type II toxin-antitoxin system Phd/YefM family antitoxin [bacterium]|nr:type II toxin-antitoxin system Phd/YefM family antitoxin [bacterium]
MKKAEGSLQTTKTIPAFIARTQLGQILERASKDQNRFLISRRGQAAAVIMGIEDYLTNIIKQPEVLTKLQEQAAKSGASKLTLEEIDQEIASVRKKRKT